jgi:hypothetical protein
MFHLKDCSVVPHTRKSRPYCSLRSCFLFSAAQQTNKTLEPFAATTCDKKSFCMTSCISFGYKLRGSETLSTATITPTRKMQFQLLTHKKFLPGHFWYVFNITAFWTVLNCVQYLWHAINHATQQYILMTKLCYWMAYPPTWVLLGRKCPSGLPQVDCSTEAKLLSVPLDIGKIRNAAVWLFLPAISITQCKTSFSGYHIPQAFKRPLCNFCKVAGSFCFKLSGCLSCSVMCPLKHAVSINGI